MMVGRSIVPDLLFILFLLSNPAVCLLSSARPFDGLEFEYKGKEVLPPRPEMEQTTQDAPVSLELYVSCEKVLFSFLSLLVY